MRNRFCQLFLILAPSGPATGQIHAAGYDLQQILGESEQNDQVI